MLRRRCTAPQPGTQAPKNPFDAHRALLSTGLLDEIFTWQ